MTFLYRRDSFTIRTATEDDIPAILALERSLYSTPWSEQSFRFELSHDHSMFWVFIWEESLAGYQVGWSIVNSYHLHNLAVMPAYQGQGLGSEVLRFLQSYLERLALQAIELEVRASNVRGLALYKKLGYRVIGIRRRYYREPTEDAILMQNLI